MHLHKTDEATFHYWIQEWYEKYIEWLYEKRWNLEKERPEYIHKRTIQAYNAIKRFLPYLFTHEQVLPDLDIPHTTNSLESTFSHLKDKVRIHR